MSNFACVLFFVAFDSSHYVLDALCMYIMCVCVLVGIRVFPGMEKYKVFVRFTVQY